MSTEKELIIYTDGAALGNPGKGGYGIVLIWGSVRKQMHAAYRHTTNNRMELLAVIVALETLKKNGFTIHIYTDSQYVFNAIDKKWLIKWQNQNWKDKKNVDLWKRFMPLWKLHEIRMHWVKGHAGNRENEVCDVLATTAAKEGPWLKDVVYEAESGYSEQS